MWYHITLINLEKEIPLNFTISESGNFYPYHTDEMVDSIADAIPEGFVVSYVNNNIVPHIRITRDEILFGFIAREGTNISITINNGLFNNMTSLVPLEYIRAERQYRLVAEDTPTHVFLYIQPH